MKLDDVFAGMGDSEKYDAIFKDHLTGAYNRRAFDTEYSGRGTVAIIDLDSLKYINDEMGHRDGDSFLISLVHSLPFWVPVYRLGGDEFAIIHPFPVSLLQTVQEVFPVFTFGVGETLDEADANLEKSKKLREAKGLRAARGERPHWLTDKDLRA